MRNSSLTSFAEAQRRWREALDAAGCPERLDAETVALTDAVGRVCARVERTLRPCPTYRAAAMDGFAIRAADVGGVGGDGPIPLKIGPSAEAIDTGEAIPEAFDAVVPIEHVRSTGGYIEIDAPVPAGKNVRLPGDDVPPGVAIGWPGRPLRALDCATLLAGGRVSIEAVRRPRLAIVPTGDELVPAGSAPREGTVIETNSTMIAHAARALGATVHVAPIVRDDDAVLERELRSALEASDVVVLLAGSSTGRRDRAAAVIAAVGSVDVHGVATRPARPVILGHSGSVAIAGLPGYPVSCHFAFEAYVAPLLRRLAGIADPPERRGRLAHAVDTDSASDVWRPATILTGVGSPRAIVDPLEEIGGDLYRLSTADARFHLKRGTPRFARYVAVQWSALRDPDAATLPLFTGPYDPLIEELAALAGFRCRWTQDETGEALDAGLTDAVGVLVRRGAEPALRARAGQGRKMVLIGVRSEGTAQRRAMRQSRATPQSKGRPLRPAHGSTMKVDPYIDPYVSDPWSGAAAVAAGITASARTTRYIAERFGLSYTESDEVAYACIWDDRPGHRFPWGIALPAALAGLGEAAVRLGWKTLGHTEKQPS